MRSCLVMLVLFLVPSLFTWQTPEAYACPGSASQGYGGIGTPAIYNPHWAGGFRSTSTETTTTTTEAVGRGGLLKGLLAKLRAKLHPASAGGCSDGACAEASCGVEATTEPSCAAARTEPSCAAERSTTKSDPNDRPPGER